MFEERKKEMKLFFDCLVGIAGVAVAVVVFIIFIIPAVGYTASRAAPAAVSGTVASTKVDAKVVYFTLAGDAAHVYACSLRKPSLVRACVALEKGATVTMTVRLEGDVLYPEAITVG